MTTVAFCGLGAMGAPMAANLVAAGFTVRAWNRSAHRTESLRGAVPCRTPKEATTGAEFVITMLADDAAMEAVTYGPDGVLPALGPEAIHLGMSTLSVAAVRRAATAHADQGRTYVAAPVFGRPEAAAARQLWIVAGGEAIPLDRAAPVFAALGQGTFPFPRPEQAALAKLAGNFLLGAMVESLGEALVLAEKGGLDPEQFLALMTSTLFGVPVYRGYGARIARTEFVPPGFALALARKDFRLIREASAQCEAPMPVADLVLDRLTRAIELGRQDYDFAGLTSVIREDAGLPERR